MSLADNIDVPLEILDATVVIPQHVVHRTFVSETVVLNLETGKYHGLNRVAGRMLEVLATTGSPRQTASLLAEEFGQPVDQLGCDIADLCSGLARRGLIELRDGSQG
jgi:hypothetical protein